MNVQQKATKLTDLLTLSQRPLYTFIRAQVRTDMDADDLFQQTAVVLCEEFGTYDPSKPFIAWACGIAWKRILLHYRNSSRLKLLTGPKLGAILAEKYVSSAAGVELRQEKLRECLALLKPESRKIIEQHYYRGEGIGAISGELGVSESCVYKTLARIRRTLLDCIARKLKEEFR
jgi:RNA polymerase sigma-70 factor, ECF subfamily